MPDEVEPSRGRLVGRRRELDALDDLVSHLREGRSTALVVRGEAGVGKTALLQHLAARAPGCRIARASGVESEMEIAFAGLHQLCAPDLDRLDRLPGPQRDALRTAFGMLAGPPPDRFLIGLAVLSLLAEAAGDQSLICVIDDAQWLDRASLQALAFAARRVDADALALVFAVREPSDEPELAGLPDIVVDGLSDTEARALLDGVVTGPLDEQVRSRIVAETRGNPLALLEVVRGSTPEQVAGGLGLAGAPARAVSGRIVESLRRRLETLPAATRRLLLLAAAESGQDAALVRRAADRWGITPEAAEPAAAEGLIGAGSDMRFCHPLARSTAYRSAPPQERRNAHRALADATDPDDPDRRAWHRSQATLGLDEDVAAELEQSADRARARGGVAAAAAFRERAAEITPDPARRSARALAAAQAKYHAGAPDRALRLLAIAEAGPRDETAAARADLLRAHITTASAPDRAAGLLHAAERLQTLDVDLARETYRDAFYSALRAGRLASSGRVRDVAAAVGAAPPTTRRPDACTPLLDGLARLISDGYAAGAPSLRTALHAFRDTEVRTDMLLRWLPLVSRVSHDMWDDESWHVLSRLLTDLARDRGTFSVLPVGLNLRLAERLFAGDVSSAVAMAEEGQAIAEATGATSAPYGALVVAAWRGEKSRTEELAAAATPETTARGEGQWLTAVAWATALLHNGSGQYEAALAAAERGSEYPEELGLANWSMVELVEAAARTGKPERAACAARRLTQMADACATDWALGTAARARALLAEGEAAERAYRKAIDHLGRTRVRSALARAHLVYGEWLRREHRRVDARRELRLAHEMLAAMGAEAFAERARHELLATGETVRKRTVAATTELTDQERHIARLAVAGYTNPEIGGQLFISPRTVEWHLRKVFSKLGVGSRRELRHAVDAAALVPAR
ncbi:transcriptional regulator [Actinomycetospora sp. NBRC 106375]|uniref:helix-turn-helix transcriptional regulator n=1 Tax=Actinomycetospora sp. NBRC 106375 TaxID=3032207 RepID=UPI0024A3A47A|nr:LuxR family transcriptional regulator [Actinomycetospora sp. NBRC 106375]GLZ48855.1 transcriptional regulator [Actinomycetospora sp. NBRC 106375]